MDYTEYYKELKREIYIVLKPLGFRKSGSCFRRELGNGIVWEVEIQKSQFNIPSQGWSQFTINVKAGLFPEPVTPLSWKRNHPQLCGNLGTKADEGWSHQHWVERPSKNGVSFNRDWRI